MADKPLPSDQNILVYVPDYQNAALQTPLSSRKSVYYRGYESPRCDSVRSETTESTCSSLSSADTNLDNEQSDIRQEQKLTSIAPPYGWKRLLTNGVVIYVSPSNTALSSSEQIKEYLQTEGTCKCGLECPLDCDSTFNFDPKVLTRPWTAPVIGPGDLTKLCNHKRKLLAQASLDSLDSRYDGRKKKRKVNSQPSVSQLLAQRDKDRAIKDQHVFSNLPWRENTQFSRTSTFSNGYTENSQFTRYEECNGVQYQRVPDPQRFPQNPLPQQIQQPTQNSSQNFDGRLSYPQQYENKIRKGPTPRVEYSSEVGQTNTSGNTVNIVSSNVYFNRTPPWQQNRIQNTYERVPPLPQHNTPVPSWNNDLKKKQTKVIRKRFNEESPNSETRSSSESPSFMDDPSGYLAQQTALLNSTISRQAVNSPTVQDNVSLSSSLNKFSTRAKSKSTISSRYPDSSVERKKQEEPSSTLSDRMVDDRGPIQGATVSTSNRSPTDAPSPESLGNVVTTMASGHTASSNTITSVLAGRANTATVSVNNPSNLQQKSPVDPSQNIVNSIQQDVVKSGHILVSNNGQLIVSNSMLSPQPSVQKLSPTSSSVSQIGVQPQMINQSAVLVNTLPGPLLLQPSVVVDGLNTVQLPQIVGNVVQNQVIQEDTSMLSPDSKRKASLKKRKLSPTMGSMLLSPQGSNNVMVQPQQINAPMLQAVAILPSKTNFAGTQQLITTNMLQPLNLVQNFPIQQFLVPAGVSSMVMSDGTILQDAVQLNLLTPVQNTGVFSNSQNLLAPGMVIRTPSTQSANKVIQNNQFISSPNQFLVNNSFGGQLSPLLSVSPTQSNRNQEYIPQNVVVQQPNSTNTTVVQQNTTIVQQTTMVSNQQTQPTPTLNLNQNFILNEKPNFILTSEKQNFVLSPNSDKIIISPDNLRDKKNSVSTQTQNQVLQISSSPALVVATSSGHCHTSTFSESPPDTTTLSPVDQEVTTSLQPTSPDPSSQSLPMVHCVSSSSQQEEGYHIDSFSGSMCKQVAYVESSCLSQQPLQEKEITQDDFSHKHSACDVPDSVHITNTPESESVLN